MAEPLRVPPSDTRGRDGRLKAHAPRGYFSLECEPSQYG
jgi:hypothetical protein